MSKWKVAKVSASKIAGKPEYYRVCALGNPDYVSIYENWGFVRKDDAEAVAELLNERMKARKLAARKKKEEAVAFDFSRPRDFRTQDGRKVYEVRIATQYAGDEKQHHIRGLVKGHDRESFWTFDGKPFNPSLNESVRFSQPDNWLVQLPKKEAGE